MSLFDFLRDKRSAESATAPQTSTSIASGVSFAKPDNITVPDVVTATDVLAGAYDPSKLHPLAGIGEGLDYLSLDDDNINALPGAATALPTRGFSDDLCYGTGTTYLAGRIHSLFLSLSVFTQISILLSLPYSSKIVTMSALPVRKGLGIGGLWGLREGLTRPMPVSNARLRLNSVLNGVTRRGTFLGNSAGVLALIYNVVNSSVDALRGKHDVWGGMAAGGICGILYKSTAGVKPALAAATLMTTAAGAWSWAKSAIL